MGRFIANNSIVNALLKYSRLCVTHSCLEDLPGLGFPFDCNFIPDPDLTQLARSRNNTQEFITPIIGLTHTLSSPGALSIIPKLFDHSIYPFDCLVCTSTCALDSIKFQLEYYSSQISSNSQHTPLTPSVRHAPLGINLSDIRSSLLPRNEARSRLSIPEDAFVMLWTGRLEQHCKSNHVPYFQAFNALNKAYPDKDIYFLVYGTTVMPDLLEAFTSSSSSICPDTNIIIYDGHDISLQPLLASASNIFISLPDSFQETFGLTPIEAMACGLPVVGTNWNGYKDTIIPGRTGFLIPTLASFEFFHNNTLYESFSHDVDTLDQSSYYASNQISFDSSALFSTLSSFLESPTLSLVMGDIAVRHIQDNFDWPSVVPLYDNIFLEMQDIRTLTPQVSLNYNSSHLLSRPPFYSCFNSWPTSLTSRATFYSSNTQFSLEDLLLFLDLPLFAIYKSLAPFDSSILDVYQLFKTGSELTFDQVDARLNFTIEPSLFSRSHEISRCLSFLLKYSFLTCFSYA